jgi:hypothetical protein
VENYCQKLFDYVDLDKPTQKERFLTLGIIEPDFIIESSPKRYHLLWKPGKTDTLTLCNKLSTDRGGREADFHVRIPAGFNTRSGHKPKQVSYNYFLEN